MDFAGEENASVLCLVFINLCPVFLTVQFRLKKEHEKIRQETVKIILAEQKLNNDIVTIKKDTSELNKVRQAMWT